MTKLVKNNIIHLNSELKTKKFKNFKGELPVPFGRDVKNKQFIVDVSTLPHLLIGGAKGSGKSNFLNSLLVSLLSKHSPSTLKLILADSSNSRSPFKDLPHLLWPVISDTKEDRDMILNALNWCVEEMERRYNTLGNAACKNIKQYNKRHKGRALPYIVFTMDEMSSFILRYGKHFEGPILKLMQMSRVIGIHLIMATSKLKPEVLTGYMRANCPESLVFSVASKKDSKFMLYKPGAECLIERGDALFFSTKLLKTVKLQTPFISEDEISKFVKVLKGKHYLIS